MILTTAIVGAGAVAGNAHETRLVGPNDEYQLVVGFRVEPAFEDVVNGPDLIVSRASDNRPIDTAAGDVFNVQVEIQIRDPFWSTNTVTSRPKTRAYTRMLE